MVPFVGGSYELKRKKADVQRSINFMPTPIESGSGKSPAFLKPIPGLSKFSDIDPCLDVLIPTNLLSIYTLVSGNFALFTVVSTPYGSGLSMAAQNSPTSAIIRTALLKGAFTTYSGYFFLSARNADDSGVWQLGDAAASNAALIFPCREAAFDPLRRAHVGGTGASVPVSAAALVLNEWYRFVVTVGVSCQLTRISTGVTETTAIPGVVFGPSIATTSFRIDQDGLTCPTIFANLHVC